MEKNLDHHLTWRYHIGADRTSVPIKTTTGGWFSAQINIVTFVISTDENDEKDVRCERRSDKMDSFTFGLR